MKKLLLFLILPFPLRMLTWNDFKGKYLPKNGEIASINTGLTWEYDQQDTNIFHVNVEAEFRQYLSYSKTTSPYILNHEQQHYNIAVIFSRKANYLASLKCLFSEKEFEMFRKRIEDEWRATDSLYDAETWHSVNKEEQHKWNEWVKQQLKMK